MGHILFTDNYYTSPTLASFFLENKTHLCGTIRANRYNFPRDLVNTDLDKGTAVLFYNTEPPMIATKYRAEKDKAGGKPKVVFMLSTCHQPIKETYREIHRKPQAVKAYNSHMGGVDRVDQQLHGLQSLRKSYKWYKKLAF